jgi:hypothetical protein
MTVEQAAARLAPIVRELFSKHRSVIEEHRRRGAAELERPDFVWHILLQSFATMGNSRGQYGLIHNRANYDRLRFETLASLEDNQRRTEIEDVCRQAGVRMPRKKAQWIAEAFERIRALGGPESAKDTLLAQPGKADIIRFLRGFPGIGEKYSRNIMMDVHHELFRNSVAIDVRISRISSSMGLTFARRYPDHEAFYLMVAGLAGLSGWELDRLLYNFTSDVENALSKEMT